jgi:monoamine oxidase
MDKTCPMQGPSDVDVAIVGGGISGLYAGWRLLSARGGDQRRVAVFESSGRTGGRLLTWRPLPHTHPELNAELGGMRFFEKQQLVWHLVKYFEKEGKLQPPIKFIVNDPNGNDLWYLRENILKEPDLSNPDRLPYRLDARGRYADPASIINNVINDILAANRKTVIDQLGGHSTLDWKAWDAIKPKLRYRQRRLWNIGFWNLLSDLLSPETYQYVTDAFGYYSLTTNWNAAEAMQVLWLDFTQGTNYRTLQEGFDRLPQLVREAFEELHGGKDRVWLHHRVIRIDRADKGEYRYRLRIHQQADVLAKRVILAMPRRSLELLQESSVWQLDANVKVGKKDRTLRECIESVIPCPAFKLFLVYPTCWWRTKPFFIAAGRSISDLPIRQTYYFPSVADPFPPAKADPNGPGLVMASYDDLGAVSFWHALRCTRKQEKKSDALMKAALPPPPAAGSSRLQQYHQQNLQALIEDRGFFYAPPEMVRHAQEQLSLLHCNQPLPSPLPLPEDPQWFLAAYKDWSIDPFGGGWNFWAPRVDVKATMERMRQPFVDEDIFIIGEAYSGVQGWVEGALTTAEKVLREHFGLPRAPWQPPDNYYMGY